MVREPELLAFPLSFSAKQEYTPSSLVVALRISRLPSNMMEMLKLKTVNVSRLTAGGVRSVV